MGYSTKLDYGRDGTHRLSGSAMQSCGAALVKRLSIYTNLELHAYDIGHSKT